MLSYILNQYFQAHFCVKQKKTEKIQVLLVSLNSVSHVSFFFNCGSEFFSELCSLSPARRYIALYYLLNPFLLPAFLLGLVRRAFLDQSVCILYIICISAYSRNLSWRYRNIHATSCMDLEQQAVLNQSPVMYQQQKGNKIDYILSCCRYPLMNLLGKMLYSLDVILWQLVMRSMGVPPCWYWPLLLEVSTVSCWIR